MVPGLTKVTAHSESRAFSSKLLGENHAETYLIIQLVSSTLQ